MSNLLTHKLNELNELATHTQETIENAATHIAKQLESSTKTELAKAKAVLSELVENQNLQALQTHRAKFNTLEKQLKEQNTRDLQEAKAHLQIDFTNRLQSQLESIAQNYAHTATDTLKTELQEPITHAIKSDKTTREMIQTAAQEAARERVAELDFESFIDYAQLDSAKIAHHLAQESSYKELAKQTYKEQIQESLKRLENTEHILNALQENAQKFYTQAIKSDELLKDRYESKLRLLCFKIFGTQELVEGILQESARRFAQSQKPPTTQDMKNNILVVG